MKKYISLAIVVTLVVLSAVPAAFAQNNSPGTLPAVEEFKVKEAGNQSITLTWTPVVGANSYTLLYGTNSVTTANQEYNRPAIVTENVSEYKVTNLSNGTKYYFNIYATNGTQTSESLTDEISATPSAEGTNAAPTILETKAISSTQLNLVFSKNMNFGSNLQNEISIVKSFDQSALAVSAVTVVDSKTLKITTASQDEGAEYRLTLTDKFVDTAGTAMAATERADVFIGATTDLFSDLYGSAEGASDLTILAANVAPDKKGIELVFSKPVVFEDNARAQVAIVETANPGGSSVNITSVIPNQTEDTKVLIVVDELKPVSYTLLVLRLKDKEGKLISEANSTIEFRGDGEAGAGVGTTGEVTNLDAKLVDLAKILVQLTWGLNADIDAATLSGFRVYVAEGANSPFKVLGDIDKDSTSFDTEELNPADLYKFKVTTLDSAGQESEGAVVELELPGTGPAGLALLALSSMGLGRLITRRKI